VGRGPGRNWMAPVHGWRKDGQLEPPALPVLGAEAGLPPPDCPLLEDGGVSPERDLPPRQQQSLDLCRDARPRSWSPRCGRAVGGGVWGRAPDEDGGGAPDGAPFPAARRAVGRAGG